MAKTARKTATTATPAQPKRMHRATYSRDNRNGGYLIRVEGPHAAKFAGRNVPVTRKDGSEGEEELGGLIWSGPDKETGAPVALYTFKPRPREEEYAIDF